MHQQWLLGLQPGHVWLDHASLVCRQLGVPLQQPFGITIQLFVRMHVGNNCMPA